MSSGQSKSRPGSRKTRSTQSTLKQPATQSQVAHVPQPSSSSQAHVSPSPESRGDAWYKDAERYWANIPATVDGVLGGFASLSDPDARGNAEFVVDLFADGPDGGTLGGKRKRGMGRDRVCDCGAGIGRVTSTFLLPRFRHIDLVEVSQHFLDAARESLREQLQGPQDTAGDGVAQEWLVFVRSGLQEWMPERGRYDAVWCQWVLGHLTDADLVSFFRRCLASLRPGGLLFVKENLTPVPDRVDVDEEDSSVTRSEVHFKRLFAEAGLRVVKEAVQTGFPEGIYAVKTFALEGKDGGESGSEGVGR
ncbi:hypothetical protein M427DRAFT_71685 [Gonapodya prolifera JEL478]|uniref:Alpha N-terminal protein methyltransferase 1 n=1 Tax=Gonapodya prolifera (strain JEL478) TaxID=1344416 RepID=A0A139A861_GONPJ|nr:hypothetical protein M427DRAFT_71685 [Gonapodya prolifera JEL478]|eukprot:KXS12917.1 hypothetical protein M427DRAFT_71685 [Gonapodya prolifera JEL478]